MQHLSFSSRATFLQKAWKKSFFCVSVLSLTKGAWRDREGKGSTLFDNPAYYSTPTEMEREKSHGCLCLSRI